MQHNMAILALHAVTKVILAKAIIPIGPGCWIDACVLAASSAAELIKGEFEHANQLPMGNMT